MRGEMSNDLDGISRICETFGDSSFSSFGELLAETVRLPGDNAVNGLNYYCEVIPGEGRTVKSAMFREEDPDGRNQTDGHFQEICAPILRVGSRGCRGNLNPKVSSVLHKGLRLSKI